MLSAVELFGHTVRRELVCSSIPEKAKKKEEVEAEWSEWFDLLAERQRRPLPAFDARAGDIAREIEINVPPDLRDACREVLAVLP